MTQWLYKPEHGCGIHKCMWLPYAYKKYMWVWLTVEAELRYDTHPCILYVIPDLNNFQSET